MSMAPRTNEPEDGITGVVLDDEQTSEQSQGGAMERHDYPSPAEKAALVSYAQEHGMSGTEATWDSIREAMRDEARQNTDPEYTADMNAPMTDENMEEANREQDAEKSYEAPSPDMNDGPAVPDAEYPGDMHASPNDNNDPFNAPLESAASSGAMPDDDMEEANRAQDAEGSAAAFEAAQEKLNEAKANEQNAREARTLGDDESQEAYRQALDAYEAAGQEQREAYGRAVAAYGSENALHEALSGGDPNLGGSAAPAEGLATTSSPIDAMKEAYKNAPTIAKPSRASRRRTQTGGGGGDNSSMGTTNVEVVYRN